MIELVRTLEQVQEPDQPVVGIFTQLRTPSKEESYRHPEGKDSVWLNLDLPLRSGYDVLPKGQITVLGLDGLAALTKTDITEELILYWERFSRVSPSRYGSFIFSIWDGIIQRFPDEKQQGVLLNFSNDSH